MGGTSYYSATRLTNLNDKSKVFVHFDGSVSIQYYQGADSGDFNMDCSGCEVTQKITDVQCLRGGTKCFAAWIPDVFDNIQMDCDQCLAPSGTTIDCTASVIDTRTNTITTTSTSIDELGRKQGLSIEGGVTFLVEGKITASYEVNYSHTWESSKSQSETKTTAISSDCTIHMPAGVNATTEAQLQVGKIIGDVMMTVERKDNCNAVDTSSHQAHVAIANVASTQAKSSCKWVGAKCNSTSVDSSEMSDSTESTSRVEF